MGFVPINLVSSFPKQTVIRYISQMELTSFQVYSNCVLTQSELFEPVLPPAAQLGIHFLFHNTQFVVHFPEGPYLGHSTSERRVGKDLEDEEKSTAPIGIQTHDILIMRPVLHHCTVLKPRFNKAKTCRCLNQSWLT